MGIKNFFNRTISTQRQTAVAGSFRQDWEDLLDSVCVAIHPVNGELVSLQGGAFYNQFKMFAPTGSDIKVGDRIIDGDDIYTVKGRSDYDDLNNSSNQHLRFSILKGE